MAESQGQNVIVKKFKAGFLGRYAEKNRLEATILSRLDNDAIPKLIEVLDNGIVIEEKPGMTVERLLFKRKYGFSEAEVYSIGIQLIEIIAYLHQNSIVHRDIRIPNVILDSGKVQLVDFGLARFIDDETYRADIDFSYLGDFLLYLIYSSIAVSDMKNLPWYQELDISAQKKLFLKRLLRLEEPYQDIDKLKSDFVEIFNPSGI